MNDPLPTDIANRALDAAGLARAPLQAITTGMSGAHVLGAGAVVLKIIPPSAPHEHDTQRDEIAALRWLHGRIRVPDVVWQGTIDGYAVLAMEKLHGHPLYDRPAQTHEAGLAAIVRTLAVLHALPAKDCPLDQRAPAKIARAAANVAAGVVDETDFDDEHAGVTAQALFDKLLAQRHIATGGAVVTHGDACIPNFILDDDGAVGLIDLGRAGVSDPYQDFALFLRSAEFNFPALDARAILVREYPLAALDDERLAFFRLLDEFF